MKVRINKKLLADMPIEVRVLVNEWRAKYGKSFISVEHCETFCPDEDARVTVINLATGASQTERVAGEFAGMTRLSPTAEIPLPVGVVAVETGFFCGTPWLTIHQGSRKQIGSEVVS